jgi:hypothetical protein
MRMAPTGSGSASRGGTRPTGDRVDVASRGWFGYTVHAYPREEFLVGERSRRQRYTAPGGGATRGRTKPWRGGQAVCILVSSIFPRVYPLQGPRERILVPDP